MIDLRALVSENAVSLHEPVFVDCSFANRSPTALRIDLGPGRVEAFRVTVETSIGIGEFRRTSPGFADIGSIEIAADAKHHERLLLQNWYRFEVPGRYRVTIGALLEGVRLDAAPFHIDILSRDPDRLRATCLALMTQALSGGGTQSAIDAAHALAQVADPVAVPFLEQLLTGFSIMRYQAIEGLGRIDDEGARALLQRLSEDADLEIAALARQALLGDQGGTPAD